MEAIHSAETAKRFNNDLICLRGDLFPSKEINKHWNNIQSSLHTAAEKVLGDPKEQNRPWISHETLALTDKRSRIKQSEASPVDKESSERGQSTVLLRARRQFIVADYHRLTQRQRITDD